MFDTQAKEEGYSPCILGETECQLQLVRPGKVQCDCESKNTKIGKRRNLKELEDFLRNADPIKVSENEMPWPE